jgi:hypothetical protein
VAYLIEDILQLIIIDLDLNIKKKDEEEVKADSENKEDNKESENKEASPHNTQVDVYEKLAEMAELNELKNKIPK